MSRVWTAVVAAVLLASLGLAQTPARAQESVTLTGAIVNGTAGSATDYERLPITLRVFQGTVALQELTSVPANDGSFAFAAVPFNANYTYFLSVEHTGAIYSSTLRGDQVLLPARLDIFEPSADLSVLTVTSYTIIVTGADAGLGIVELLERATVVNPTDRTLVTDLTGAGMPSLLRFGLPAGFHALNVHSNLVGGDVLEVDRGFALTTPLPPSAEPHVFEFVYRVPYGTGELDLARPLPFGASTVRVVLPPSLAAVSAPQLTDLGTTSISGRELRLLEGSGFEPGTRLGLSLSNLPQQEFLIRLAHRAGEWYLAYGIPALLAGGLTGLVIAGALWHHRRPQPSAPATREHLLARLVALEQASQRGRASAYRERAEVKHRLLLLELKHQHSSSSMHRFD